MRDTPVPTGTRGPDTPGTDNLFFYCRKPCRKRDRAPHTLNPQPLFSAGTSKGMFSAGMSEGIRHKKLHQCDWVTSRVASPYLPDAHRAHALVAVEEARVGGRVVIAGCCEDVVGQNLRGLVYHSTLGSKVMKKKKKKTCCRWRVLD